MEPHVVISGWLSVGIEIHGVFPSKEAAEEWATVDEIGEILPLHRAYEEQTISR